MSHVRKIEIKNFKSIRHVLLNECRRVNLLIGPPNVGKSNFLEGLSLMMIIDFLKTQPTPSGSTYKNVCRYSELSELFYNGDLELEIQVFIENIQMYLKYKNSNTLTVEVHFLYQNSSINEEFSLGKNGFIWQQKRTANKPLNALKFKKYYFQFISFDDSENYLILESPYGQNLHLLLRHNSVLREECGKLFKDFNLKLIFDENKNLHIQKELDTFSAFKIPFYQVADTLQRLIFHKAAILSNKDSILLFEEPEAHMFPPYISNLTADIIHDENNNQYFISTHSPYVVSDFMENLSSEELAIYIFNYDKTEGMTVVHRLSEKEFHVASQFGYDFFMNLDHFI
ncbi:MAG: AAA family ATPase [Chitinophagaceae bacterium]|nr:AAA family ATPase [Chitinophagaceae bacterium]